MSSRKSESPRPIEDASIVCDDGTLVVPVIAEELQVQKRQIETGGVRVRKVVHEREQVVDVPLESEELRVERVPIGRFVDGPLDVRTEGDTTIIPVVEEVAVVERRWRLKEELHVTRSRRTRSEPLPVTLRHEEAVIERLAGAGNGSKDAADRPAETGSERS